MRTRLLVLTALMPFSFGHGPGGTPKRIALAPVTLNDLSNQPVSAELPDRIRQLTDALGERLTSACGYQVVPLTEVGRAAAGGPGYLYAHPELAVELAGTEADWVVIPRLNRASPWVTDLQAHVVRVRDTTLVSNRIVEVKGIELTPELAAKLIDRGAAWMADQLAQAIEHASAEGKPTGRPCPA